MLFGRTTRKIHPSWNNERDAGISSRRIKYHHHPSTRAIYSSTLTFSQIPTTSPFRWRRSSYRMPCFHNSSPNMQNMYPRWPGSHRIVRIIHAVLRRNQSTASSILLREKLLDTCIRSFRGIIIYLIYYRTVWMVSTWYYAIPAINPSRINSTEMRCVHAPLWLFQIISEL